MTMDKLKPGQKAEMETVVTMALSINRMGREGAEVLSTPSMLDLMEQCCIKASDAHLPDGHTTVGYAVDGLRHLAPSPVGNRVRVVCELTAVDRNRLSYSIEVFDGDEKVGVAMHKRAVVPTDG